MLAERDFELIAHGLTACVTFDSAIGARLLERTVICLVRLYIRIVSHKYLMFTHMSNGHRCYFLLRQQHIYPQVQFLLFTHLIQNVDFWRHVFRFERKRLILNSIHNDYFFLFLKLCSTFAFFKMRNVFGEKYNHFAFDFWTAMTRNLPVKKKIAKTKC